jgi:UDP-glucose:(heptosyl)LPS alpha-1,3-glucosyltransferase
MKIAFVVHDFLSGVGHGRYCIELARRFAAAKHEVHVLANRFHEGLDFEFHRRNVPAWRVTALTSVLSFPRAAQTILDREQFDVIHAQGFACHRADVVTAHVCNAARYKRTPATVLRKKLFPELVIPRERHFYRALSIDARVISISKVIQREIAEEYGGDSEVIYHGVDTTVFSPRAREHGGGWKWLFAGEAVKGLSETLKALCAFPSATLEVVTRSPLQEWQQFAHKLKLDERVRFRGPTENMAPIYRDADIFVYPSAYDAFGMVAAEAMACGLPVVIDERIGAAEWVEDGVNGFLIRGDNLSSLLGKLREVQGRDWAEIGRAARATAVEHSWDECARQTMAVYKRAMASKRARQ